MSREDSYLIGKYGMPKKVAWGIAVLRDLWPYHDGPAHIVLADFNLEDDLIQACIAGIARGDTCSSEGFPPGHPIYAATSSVLQWLLDNTSEDERTGWYSEHLVLNLDHRLFRPDDDHEEANLHIPVLKSARNPPSG